MDNSTHSPSNYPIFRSGPLHHIISRVIRLSGTDSSADSVRKILLTLDLESFEGSMFDVGNQSSFRITNSQGANSSELYEGIDLIISRREHDAHLLDRVASNDHVMSFIDKDSKKYNHLIGHNGHRRLIGTQFHCQQSSSSSESSFGHLRLGDIRHDIQKAEVSLRTVETAVINLDALRLSDNLGSSGSLTTGLTIEELCHLSKYIGASTHLRQVIICGNDHKSDSFGMMSTNIALVIWYVLKGNSIRLSEIEEESIKSNTYTIVPDEFDTELTFIENPISGRWWIRVPSDLDQNGAVIACTKQDYDDACQNIISDRILEAFTKL